MFLFVTYSCLFHDFLGQETGFHGKKKKQGVLLGLWMAKRVAFGGESPQVSSYKHGYITPPPNKKKGNC